MKGGIKIIGIIGKSEKSELLLEKSELLEFPRSCMYVLRGLIHCCN